MSLESPGRRKIGHPTPHAASHTPESDERGINVFLENLRRFLNGEPLLNLADPDLGY